MSERQFGERVVVSARLVRRVEYGEIKHERWTQRTRNKVWREVPLPEPREAVFLGLRTLSNGATDWDSEVGYQFMPTDHFQAALVCFSDRENPAYVPLDATNREGSGS